MRVICPIAGIGSRLNPITLNTHKMMIKISEKRLIDLVMDKIKNSFAEKTEICFKLYEKLSEISWKSRFSLMSHNWKELGDLFTLNSEIVEEIMVYYGFKSGIGWGNKILIDLISDDPDVYSVKLTGAGGGGSVFALTKPESTGRILKEWKYKLESLLKKPEILKKKYPNLPPEIENGLKNAMFFEAILEPNGVQILQ